MKIYSIVQITEPGAVCSYRVGRFEVSHSDSAADAHALCDTYNRHRYAADLGFHYAVEEVDEESPDRAPLAELREKTF